MGDLGIGRTEEEDWERRRGGEEWNIGDEKEERKRIGDEYK